MQIDLFNANKPKKLLIAYEEAHRVFRYDQNTGKLYWRINKGIAKAGNEVGCAYKDGNVRYRHFKFGQKMHSTHRVIWFMHYGTWPKNVVDHKDRNGVNNRIENLRDVTVMENSGNRRDNTSGFVNIHFDKQTKKWRASTWVNGKTKMLNRKSTKLEAIQSLKDYLNN